MIIRKIKSLLKCLVDFIYTFIVIFRIACNYAPPLPYKIKDNPLFIIANAPSFYRQISENPNFFRDREIMCVNHLCTSELYDLLKPRYYCMMDPAFWEKPEKMDSKLRERIEKCFQELLKKTTWKMDLFIPVSARNNTYIRNISSWNSNIVVRYTPIVTYNGIKAFENWFIKKGLCNFITINVCIGALSAAMSIGYKRIYLLGADHDWIHKVVVDDHNNLVMEDNHSYEIEKKAIVLTHMDGSKEYLHELLYYNAIGFREYWKIAKYADKEGIEIYNATPSSYIDAFPRRDIFSIEERL